MAPMTASAPEAALAEAIGLYNAGRREQAHALCDRLLAHHGAHPAVDQLIAVLLQERGDAPAARRHVERSLAARPGHGPTLMIAALVYQDLREFDAAEAALQQVLQQQPAHAAAAVNLGIVHLEQGRLDDAMQRFGQAYLQRPETFGRIAHALATPSTGALWLELDALRAALRDAAQTPSRLRR